VNPVSGGENQRFMRVTDRFGVDSAGERLLSASVVVQLFTAFAALREFLDAHPTRQLTAEGLRVGSMKIALYAPSPCSGNNGSQPKR
jgi:hypothetical protein